VSHASTCAGFGALSCAPGSNASRAVSASNHTPSDVYPSDLAMSLQRPGLSRVCGNRAMRSGLCAGKEGNEADAGLTLGCCRLHLPGAVANPIRRRRSEPAPCNPARAAATRTPRAGL
jgi:hypothetical protein